MCVCVCVREKEREKMDKTKDEGGGREGGNEQSSEVTIHDKNPMLQCSQW